MTASATRKIVFDKNTSIFSMKFSVYFFLAITSLYSATSSSQVRVNSLRTDVGVCSSRPLQSQQTTSCPFDRALAEQQGSKSAEDSWKRPLQCAGIYCIYSRPDNHAGQGTVFITTATSTQRLFSSLNSPEYKAAFNLEDQLSSSTLGPPFYTTNIPGKGIGLVANRTIPRGTTILSPLPAIIIHQDFLDIESDHERDSLLEQAIDKLSPSLRKAFMGQMFLSSAHKIKSIIMTNSFNFALPGEGGDPHVANYPEVSRLNHDCRPK